MTLVLDPAAAMHTSATPHCSLPFYHTSPGCHGCAPACCAACGCLGGWAQEPNLQRAAARVGGTPSGPAVCKQVQIKKRTTRASLRGCKRQAFAAWLNSAPAAARDRHSSRMCTPHQAADSAWPAMKTKAVRVNNTACRCMRPCVSSCALEACTHIMLKKQRIHFGRALCQPSSCVAVAALKILSLQAIETSKLGPRLGTVRQHLGVYR